jgi:hypothetical protein
VAKKQELLQQQAVLRMMRGESPRALADEGVASIRQLNKWYNDDLVDGWLTCRQVCELLLTGLFHETSVAGFDGMVAKGEILPSGSIPTARTPLNDPPIAAYLKAVALFDTARKGPYMATCRSSGTMSVIAHHKPAVLLKLDRTALTSAIIEPTEALYAECKYPYRHRVPDVEVWHPGPIALSAVQGVWTWGMQPNGNELLADWTHLLPDYSSIRTAISKWASSHNLKGRDPAKLPFPRFYPD